MHIGARDILIWLLNLIWGDRHAALSPHEKVTNTHDLFLLLAYFLVLHSYRLFLSRLLSETGSILS